MLFFLFISAFSVFYYVMSFSILGFGFFLKEKPVVKYQNFPLDENSILQQALIRTVMLTVMTKYVSRQQGLGGK